MPEDKKYGIIYADPPWRYDMKRGHGVAENHYPTMSIEYKMSRQNVQKIWYKNVH